MAATAQQCQQKSIARRLVASQLASVAVLSLACLGCWQEIRFEPTKTAKSAGDSAAGSISAGAPSTQPTAAQGATAETSAAAALFEDVEFTTTKVPETTAPGIEPEILPAATSAALFGESEGSAAPRQLASTQIALASWQMSSSWSMAAALQAKGLSPDSYLEHWKKAVASAELLGCSLPELPTHDAGADPLVENLSFLLEAAGPRLADELSKQYGNADAALAELATTTHVLLLCYTPGSTRLEPLIASILQAAKRSGLPESVWQELVDLLTARADFRQVKAAIFRLHQRATAHLSGVQNR